MINTNININRKQNKGFTLVEMLVAVSILSLSILAAFTSISNNIKTARFSEDKVVAYYLASEAIEYIRNVRDENAIRNIQQLPFGASTNWLRDISSSISDPCYNRNCIVDTIANSITPCSSDHNSCPFLKKHPTSKIYGYNNVWTQSIFKRSVSVSVISATEAVVTATVTWTASNGDSKTYTLSEIIRNWQ